MQPAANTLERSRTGQRRLEQYEDEDEDEDEGENKGKGKMENGRWKIKL